MENFCISSIAFGDKRYKSQLNRLAASISIFHPGISFYYWIDEYPPESKSFNESMYGFKVWCIEYVKKIGYKKIIWLDPACYIVSKLEPYFELVKEYGIVAAQDDNLLCNYCSNKAYAYFGNTREHSKEMNEHLVGGSLYVFDFNLPLCNIIFDKWKQAEVDGIFGSQYESATKRIESHRNDESVLSLSLYSSGSKPVPYDLCRYNDVPNPLIVKEHFK